MKSMNTMMFVSSATEELVNYVSEIKSAETFVKAKAIANTMNGYLNCMATVLNTMVCTENNDITAELDELLNSWTARMYGALAAKADETKESSDVIVSLLKARDEYIA